MSTNTEPRESPRDRLFVLPDSKTPAPGLIGMCTNPTTREKLLTPEGRAELVENVRYIHAVRAHHGQEGGRYLRVADAIERADWPKLAQQIRDELRDQERVTRAQLRAEHTPIRAFARQLDKGKLL